MQLHQAKYGVSRDFDFVLVKPDGIDFEVGAFHVIGDTKIRKDGAVEANTTNGFVDEGSSYSITLSAAELQAKRIVLHIIDTSVPKIWLDTAILIETYGDAAAMHPFDSGSAQVDVKSFTTAAKAEINVEVDGALDTVVPTSPVFRSINYYLQRLNGLVVRFGTAVGGSGTTIALDAGASPIDDLYKNMLCVVSGGSGTGNSQRILSYNGTTKICTMEVPWVGQAPNNTSEFTIIGDAALIVESFRTAAKAEINVEVDGALDTAVPGSPTAGSINDRITNLGKRVVRTGTAQAGSATTVTLDAGASASDGYYIGKLCQIDGGSGAGQSEYIASYNGTTKVATMTLAWPGTAPDATSTFTLLDGGTLPGASAPTAGQVANAVLDEVRANHDTAGSVGEAINDAHAGAINTRQVDRSTGDIKLLEDDGVTVRNTQRITEIDANTQGIVKQ